MYSHRLLKILFFPLLIFFVAFTGCNAKKDVAQITPGVANNSPNVANNSPGTTDTRPSETYTKGNSPASDRDSSNANNRGQGAPDRQPAMRDSERPAANDRARESVPSRVDRTGNSRSDSSNSDTVVPDEEERETARPKHAVGSTPEVGEPIKPITGTDVDGIEFSLSDYSGKVTMIDFWGDW